MRLTLPKGKPLLTMVWVGGPQPLYDVEWTRNTVRVYPDKQVWCKAQSRSLNNKGVMATRTGRWFKSITVKSVERYQHGLESIGYRRLEV
jgi:hypothetical protein